jgi:sugar phosphate isomerase/epimerase
MQIACHAWAFSNLPLAEAVGTIARLGFRSIDLGSGPHIDVMAAAKQPQVEAAAIRQVVEEFGLTITDLYLLLPHVNSPEPARREAQLLLFRRLIPFAIELGTPGVTVSPGIVQADGPDHSLARAVPALQRIVDATENTDLRISFEPHLDSAAATPENALLLLEAVPGLSLTLDIAHLITQGITWRNIRHLFEHTAHVQVRQARRDRLQTPFEKGKLDIEQLVVDLAEEDYHGVVSVEYMTTVGWHGMMEVNIAQEVVKTRDALREARRKVLHH